MNQQEQQFCSQPQQIFQIKELFPANPIYERELHQEIKPGLKVEIIKTEMSLRQPIKPVFKKQLPEEQQQQYNENQDKNSLLRDIFSHENNIFMKYKNKQLNSPLFNSYFASKFIDKKILISNKQPLFKINQFKSSLQLIATSSQSKSSQIKFNSDFQSGNLFAVYQKNYFQFDLVLENDVNTKGNTQWFYFTVTNLPKDLEVTFNILNLMKSDSLFNYGMQPVVMSSQKLKRYGQGWQRMGKNISYTRNQFKRQYSRRNYYTLKFKLSTKFSNDVLHIAHCYPYNVTMLNEYLSEICKNSYKKMFLKRSNIGKSLGNHNIQCLTIAQKNQKSKDSRKVIVIMGRQHPGEPQSSYVCQGIINFLTSKQKEAQFLRKHYIIKIFPMINPDGVIVGNYRCNLMGYDLNRRWNITDKKNNFPEVTLIKDYLVEISKQRKIVFLIDLHGHSKKLNSFFYGNPYPKQPQIVKIYPYICSRLNPHISYADCTFSIEEQKKKAARVYLALTHNIQYIYTFESSFYGYIKENKRYHFGIQQFKNLGSTLSLGLFIVLQYEFLNGDKNKQLSTLTYMKYMNELKSNYELLNIGDHPTSGSQSRPELYEFTEMELQKNFNQQKKNLSEKKAQIYMQHTFSTPNAFKHKKDLKQQFRNTKKLHFIELNCVQTPFLSKKHELLLHPSGSNDKPRTVHLQNEKIREIHKRRQSEGSINRENNFKELINSSSTLKTSTYVQTEQQIQNIQKEFIELRTNISFSEKTDALFSKTPLIKKNLELKYVSLSNAKEKKNIALKLDLVSKPKNQLKNILIKSMNACSQTILSFNKMSNQSNNTNYLPSLESINKSKECEYILNFQFLKTNKLTKQIKDEFNINLTKKYMTDLKQNKRSREVIHKEQKIFLQTSLNSKFDEIKQQTKSKNNRRKGGLFGIAGFKKF